MDESFEAMVKRVMALSAVLVTVATPEEVKPSSPSPAPLTHPLPTTDHSGSLPTPSEQVEPLP